MNLRCHMVGRQAWATLTRLCSAICCGIALTWWVDRLLRAISCWGWSCVYCIGSGGCSSHASVTSCNGMMRDAMHLNFNHHVTRMPRQCSCHDCCVIRGNRCGKSTRAKLCSTWRRGACQHKDRDQRHVQRDERLLLARQTPHDVWRWHDRHCHVAKPRQPRWTPTKPAATCLAPKHLSARRKHRLQPVATRIIQRQQRPRATQRQEQLLMLRSCQVNGALLRSLVKLGAGLAHGANRAIALDAVH